MSHETLRRVVPSGWRLPFPVFQISIAKRSGIGSRALPRRAKSLLLHLAI